MKQLFFLPMLFIALMMSCSSVKTIEFNKTIEFKIIDKEFKKEAKSIKMLVTNHSNTNYFLPMDMSDKDFICKEFYSSAEERKFMYLKTGVESINGDTLQNWVFESYSCCDIDFDKAKRLRDHCFDKNRMNKILLLEAHSDTIVNVPVYLKIEFDECDKSYIKEYDSIKDFTHYIMLEYNQKDRRLLKNYFSEKLLDSLSTEKYVLYDKKIVSNKIIIRE